MYKFTITTKWAIVIATIDTDDAEETAKVDYQEISLYPNSFMPPILGKLHEYIESRGGMFGHGINPMVCRANDLRYALTTPYKIATSYNPGFKFEVAIEGQFNPPSPPRDVPDSDTSCTERASRFIGRRL